VREFAHHRVVDAGGVEAELPEIAAIGANDREELKFSLHT
jgi:hypothetical protein